MRLLLLAGIGVLGLTACSNESSPPAPTTESEAAAPQAPQAARELTAEQKARVDKAVAVRIALETGQDPDAVLKAQGLTEQGYDDLLFEIASDEAMSAAYAARTGP